MIIVSSMAQNLSRSRLGLVSLVTSMTKALYGQVGDQVGQVKDQVSQGQGQELDNREVVQNLSISMMNIMCTDKYLTNQINVVTILKRTRKS